jgi:uncharacterized membrane protein
MSRLSSTGRICSGIAVAGSGAMQVINGQFVRLVPGLPAWMPGHSLLAVVSGVGLVLIGGALVANRQTRRAAVALAVLLVCVFLLRVPEILANPGAGFVWTNPAKVLAALGGGLLLAHPARRGRLVAAGLLAAFLLLAGVQHFVYAGFVDTLVPTWIPPGQRFWTLFSAVALLAGGFGLLIPATVRPAGFLSGLMILLWVLLLHIPRSIEMRSAFELAGVFEALAIGGVAWLVAATGETPSRSEVK